MIVYFETLSLIAFIASDPAFVTVSLTEFTTSDPALTKLLNDSLAYLIPLETKFGNL